MKLREVRVLVNYEGTIRKICKLVVSHRDASLYVIPYASRGQFHFGATIFPQEVQSLTFDFTRDYNSDSIPKLSLHESGQVHVTSGEERVAPVTIPPLSSLTGDHIASVSVDRFDTLVEFDGLPRSAGSRVDHLVPVAHGVESGRLAIYASAQGPVFPRTCRLTLTLQRKTHVSLIHFGIATISQKPLSTSRAASGVEVIAGWNPKLPADASQNLLWIRGI